MLLDWQPRHALQYPALRDLIAGPCRRLWHPPFTCRCCEASPANGSFSLVQRRRANKSCRHLPPFLFVSREFSPRINNSSLLVLGFLLFPVIPVPPTTAFCLCDISFSSLRRCRLSLKLDLRRHSGLGSTPVVLHTTGFTAQ